jgi:hypothetical protein
LKDVEGEAMIDAELLKQYFPQLQWKVSAPEYNDHCKSLCHSATGAAIDRQGREVASCHVGLEEGDDGSRRWECDFYLNDRDNFNAVQFGYDFSDQEECLNWLRSQVAKTANMLTLALVGDELIALPELQQRRDQIIADAPKKTDAIISAFWHNWRDTPQELPLDPPSGHRLLAIDLDKVASHEGLYIACHFKFTPVPVRLLPDGKRYHAYALLYYGPIEQEPSDLRSRYDQMCGLIHPDALVFRGS